MTAAPRLGPLDRSHRARVEAIVRGTKVFSDEEVRVALEVFDAATESAAPAGAPAATIAADYELLGAFLLDELVGYACWGPTPATDRTYDLYWIAVHPEAQRAGAGAALMAEVERRLAASRARLLVIETSSRADYAATRRFYDRRGYQPAARLPDFYAPGDDRIVLARRLDAVPSPGGPDRFPLPAPHL